MIRDITIGQYYPAKSVIHRMDPRTKLFGTLIFIFPYSCSTAWQDMPLQRYSWQG